MTRSSHRRHFTSAARAAALEARRKIAAEKSDLSAPALFVVRHSSDHLLFGWEIRRYGGVRISRSDMGYVDQSMARAAGKQALAALVLHGR